MNRENLVWLVVFALGAAILFGRAMFTEHGMSKVYVTKTDRQFVNSGTDEAPAWTEIKPGDVSLDFNAFPEDKRVQWTEQAESTYRAFKAQETTGGTGPIQFSFSKTLGVWVAALLTLFVLSFLIKDNPLYKFAESVFIGVSAAYWMVSGFWDTIVPNLIAKISPELIRNWSMPGLGANETTEWVYLIPLVLGIMLLWRLSPVGGWISRWPMAFFIGTFCGLRLISYLHGDFLSQIRNSVKPVYEPASRVLTDPQTGAPLVDAATGSPLLETFWPTVWASMSNIILLVGVFACIVYFFFSFEHRGAIGKTARLGIWFLMVTFGAGFGYTVMGRIALLAIRIEFLFDDWLWLIDPTDKRLLAEAVALIAPAFSCLGFG